MVFRAHFVADVYKVNDVLSQKRDLDLRAAKDLKGHVIQSLKFTGGENKVKKG